MRSQAGSPSPACSPAGGHRRCPLTPLSSPRLVNNVGMVYVDSKLKRLLECEDPGQVSEALLGGLHCSPTLCCPLSERARLAAAGRCLLCCCPLPMAALHHLPCPVVLALQNDPGGGGGPWAWRFRHPRALPNRSVWVLAQLWLLTLGLATCRGELG